jgi:hypothetical protein
MSKRIVTKTVLRTLVYQFLILFTGLSIGFITHANYWGNRAPLIEKSVKNIFYPVEYNKEVKEFLTNVGKSRIFFSLPPGSSDLIIIEDRMISDEQYMADYEYVLNGEKIVVNGYVTKINWKPWEYDYPNPEEKEMLTS